MEGREDKEKANKVAQQERRAAALTAELAAQSEKKTADRGLTSSLGTLRRHMGAGGSQPQATMMPDPWATNRRPSANEGQTTTSTPPETNRCGLASCVPADKGTFALTTGFRDARSWSATRNVETRSMVDEASDFYMKATGRDGTQKRQELVNMKPGELRRSLERWQARAKEVQRLQDKREQAWNLDRRVPNFRRKKKEDFEKDLGHKAMYNGKVDEKRLQEWTDEIQSKVQAAERQLEARERERMESEDSSSQRRRAWEKLWEPRAFTSLPYFSSLPKNTLRGRIEGPGLDTVLTDVSASSTNRLVYTFLQHDQCSNTHDAVLKGWIKLELTRRSCAHFKHLDEALQSVVSV